MKKYNITFSALAGGYVEVLAESPEEATEKARDIGIDILIVNQEKFLDGDINILNDEIIFEDPIYLGEEGGRQ
jgi:hypothetical protein